MNQQINLLQTTPDSEREPLQARAVLAILGVVLAGVVTLAAWDGVRVASLKKQAAQLAARQEAAAARLADYEQKYAPRPPSKLLQNQLAKLEKRLAQRQEVERMLSSGEVGNSDGLSPYLEALARRHVEGTWYTRVAISAGGNAVGLSGRSIAPELVPELVQQLADEVSFSGLSFSAMQIARRKAPARDVSFSMTTRGLDWSDADG